MSLKVLDVSFVLCHCFRHSRRSTLLAFVAFLLPRVRTETISVGLRKPLDWSTNEIVHPEPEDNSPRDDGWWLKWLNLEHLPGTEIDQDRIELQEIDPSAQTWFSSSFSQKTPLMRRCSQISISRNRDDEQSLIFERCFFSVNHLSWTPIWPIAFSMSSWGDQTLFELNSFNFTERFSSKSCVCCWGVRLNAVKLMRRSLQRAS